MKTMYAILWVGLAVIFASVGCDQNPMEASSVFAESGSDQVGGSGQPEGGGPDRGQHEAPPAFLLDGPGPFFLWALDLTEAQQEAIKTIGEKYKPQGGPTQGGRPGEPPDADAQAQHEEQMEAMREEMAAVLSDAQKALLAEIEADLENGQYPSIAVEKKVAFLTEKLGLIADQQNAVADLIAEYGNRWLGLRQPGSDPRQSHEAMRELLTALEEAFLSILTEDQVSAYQTLKAEMKPPRPEGQGPPPGPRR